MTLTKLEAFLNLLIMLTIVGVFAQFTRTQEAVADVVEATKQDSRTAQYEMDAYEICTIVDKLPDSVCDRLLEE